MRETRGDVVVGVCVRACVDVFIRVCVCFSFICEGLFCMFVCVFLRVFAFLQVCAYMFMCVRICKFMCVGMFICVRMCCFCVRVIKGRRHLSPPLRRHTRASCVHNFLSLTHAPLGGLDFARRANLSYIILSWKL